MTRRTKYAIGVGAFAAFLACIAGSWELSAVGHRDAGRVCALASLPWLFLALWTDRR